MNACLSHVFECARPCLTEDEPPSLAGAYGAGRGWGRTAAAEACVLHRDPGNFRSPLSRAKRVSHGMMADRTAPLRQPCQGPMGRAARPFADRHEVLVVTERHDHEGAGAAPDTGRRSPATRFLGGTCES
jgi:hypothetical protein